MLISVSGQIRSSDGEGRKEGRKRKLVEEQHLFLFSIRSEAPWLVCGYEGQMSLRKTKCVTVFVIFKSKQQSQLGWNALLFEM